MKYSSVNKPLECILTESRCYNRSSKMKVRGILWHSTAAPNTTIRRYVQPSKNDPKYDELMGLIGKNAYNNDWNDPNLKVCVHAFIGTLKDGTIASVQTLPWDLACYGCGAGSRGSCNDGWIQFEICEDSLSSKTYFDKVYKEACELTAYLCKLYDLDPMATTTYNDYEIPVVLCHKDANTYKMGSNHGDVMHWFKKYNKTMDDVRKDVAKLLGTSSVVVKPVEPIPVPTSKIEVGSVVKVANNAVYTNGKQIPNFVKNNEWIVESVVGDRIVINKSADGKYSIMSAVDRKYLQLAAAPVSEKPVEPIPEKAEPESETFKSYIVSITASLLNYRSGPGMNYSIKGQVKRGGAYTIVEEQNGWGKLKSGAGWIALEYTKKI